MIQEVILMIQEEVILMIQEEVILMIHSYSRWRRLVHSLSGGCLNDSTTS